MGYFLVWLEVSCIVTSRIAPLPISTAAHLTLIPPSSPLWVLTGWCPGSRSTIFTTLHPHSGKSSSGPAVEQVGGWANRLQEHFGEQTEWLLTFYHWMSWGLQRRSSVDEWGGKGLEGPASKNQLHGSVYLNVYLSVMHTWFMLG